MSIVVTSPATIFELADMAEANTRFLWLVARKMWAQGETFAIRLEPAGELLAVCFLYPLEGGNAEACFNVSPKAAPHMVSICRAIRLTIEAAAYPAIVTVIVSPAGARIARASGFVRQPDSAAGEVWGYGKPIQRSGGGPAKGNGGPAAHDAGPVRPAARPDRPGRRHRRQENR